MFYSGCPERAELCPDHDVWNVREWKCYKTGAHVVQSKLTSFILSLDFLITSSNAFPGVACHPWVNHWVSLILTVIQLYLAVKLLTNLMRRLTAKRRQGLISYFKPNFHVECEPKTIFMCVFALHVKFQMIVCKKCSSDEFKIPFKIYSINE